MVVKIKWVKVRVIILAFLFAIGLITCLLHNRQNNSAQVALAAWEDQSTENRLLVWLFIDEIQVQNDLFYQSYYTMPPTVAYYSTYVDSIKENGAKIEITFYSLPYIGPHDTVGEDKITFQVNHSGEIMPVSFRHLKSYPLPDNLISIQKELPPAE